MPRHVTAVVYALSCVCAFASTVPAHGQPTMAPTKYGGRVVYLSEPTSAPTVAPTVSEMYTNDTVAIIAGVFAFIVAIMVLVWRQTWRSVQRERQDRRDTKALKCADRKWKKQERLRTKQEVKQASMVEQGKSVTAAEQAAATAHPISFSSINNTLNESDKHTISGPPHYASGPPLHQPMHYQQQRAHHRSHSDGVPAQATRPQHQRNWSAPVNPTAFSLSCRHSALIYNTNIIV